MSEGENWRDYDVARTIRVAVPMTINTGHLRMKQTKPGNSYCVNFGAGMIITQGVLDRLLRDGSLTAHASASA
jgi:hypothetical protein